MTIENSSVANSIVKCTKRTWNMDVLITSLHHQDLNSKTMDMLSSTRTSSLTLQHKYLKLLLNNKRLWSQMLWAPPVPPFFTTMSQYSGKIFGGKCSIFYPSNSRSINSVTVNVSTVTGTGLIIALGYQEFEIPTYFKHNLWINSIRWNCHHIRAQQHDLHGKWYGWLAS